MRQSAKKAARERSREEQHLRFDEMRARIDALEAELAEARERETATAEVLGVINASPGDLTPVFDAILERALDLCEAKCGNITIYDGEAFNFVAAAGHAEFDEWVRQNGPARPDVRVRRPPVEVARLEVSSKAFCNATGVAPARSLSPRH